MGRTRVCPAALHVLQFSALVLVIAPAIPLVYHPMSLLAVPTITFGLHAAADDKGLPKAFRTITSHTNAVRSGARARASCLLLPISHVSH